MLATLATWGRNESIPVVVVTGDRDAFQLVEDPYVKVLYNRRGVSDYSLYDEAGIFERCGIESRRYPLLAALRGDTSDNLPGVPGVGEKTAAKLFAQYRDMDDLYAHLGDLTPKLRENLATFEERARNNEKVMMLIRDVPLDFTLHDITLGGWDRAEIDAFFDRFEMNQMRTRFGQLMKEGLLGDAGASAAPLRRRPTAKKTMTAQGTDRRDVARRGVGRRRRRRSWPIATRAPRCSTPTRVWSRSVTSTRRSTRSPRVAPCGHDLKALYRAAARTERVLLEPADDTAIMAFLLDANSGRYDLAEVAQRFLGEPIVDTSPSLFDSTTSDETLIYEVALIARLREHLRAEIAQWELNFVYEQVELPLVMVLGLDGGARRPRRRGAAAHDRQGVHRRGRRHSTREIQKVAGHEFKVNSPQQLQTVLFDETGTHGGEEDQVRVLDRRHEPRGDRRTSTRSSPLILRYREVEKLRGTYGAPLIDAVQADGRIHATFHQMVARTGRLSSDGPNLHNIPVRSKEGRRLRYAFVPSEGWQIAVSDYNQIELRILAHLSQDSGLLAAFASHEDVHRTIAASVFGIAPEDVVARTARTGQGRLLRPGLRHGGLRPEPAPRRAGERRQGDHGQVLRGLPVAARLHGPDDQGHPRQGLLAHRVRARSGPSRTSPPRPGPSARRPSVRR